MAAKSAFNPQPGGHAGLREKEAALVPLGLQVP
jgi:hypothetical protein